MNQISIFDLPPETEEQICPICHEPPRFEPCEMTSGAIWYKIGCKCGLFPRIFNNLYGTEASAIEHWLDPEKREITW